MPLSNEHLGLGHKKRGGRKRGIRNKVTADLKEMILKALGQAGGANYLFLQAERNPVAFMTLLGKIIPLQVAGDGGERRFIVEIAYVRPGEPLPLDTLPPEPVYLSSEAAGVDGPAA